MQFILLTFLFLCTLQANESYESGKLLYEQKGCGGCHGNKLEGIHQYPYLSNRSRDFLTYKLMINPIGGIYIYSWVVCII